MEKIKFNVTGMSCAHCEKAVVNALEDLGVISTKASAKDKTVEVEFDSAKLSAEDIRKEIAEIGYTATHF